MEDSDILDTDIDQWTEITSKTHNIKSTQRSITNTSNRFDLLANDPEIKKENSNPKKTTKEKKHRPPPIYCHAYSTKDFISLLDNEIETSTSKRSPLRSNQYMPQTSTLMKPSRNC